MVEEIISLERLQMKENEKRFSDAVMLMAQEQGYHKRDDRVYADCNGCLRSAVTAVELIHALYEHIARAHGYQEKSPEEILACLDKAQRDYQTTKSVCANPEVLYRVLNIGEVVFNCDIYQTKVDITSIEANYGSMEAIVKGIWLRRIQGVAALEAIEANWKPIPTEVC